MLQSIRDKTHGWIAGIIISILILSFALWGIHSYIEGAADTSTIAKVNGVDITKSQLAVTYERLRRQLQMQYSSSYSVPEQAESSIKAKALQTLVDIQVLKQASIKEGYRISSLQVDSLLESLPEFQVSNRFSMARFQQVLSTTLFSVGDFLDLLETSLLMDQPRLGILLTSFALPNETSNAITLVNQERKIQYASLLFQEFLKQPITVPAEKIQAYYKAHESEFKTPEQVSIDYVELSIDTLKQSMKPSEDEIKNYFNENSNSFATTAGWKLEAIFIPLTRTASDKEAIDANAKMADIQNKLKQGAAFTDLAHQNPAPNLKLDGIVVLNQVPAELQKAVVSLTKSGQVLETPVQTSKGLILLKADQVQSAQIESYEKVKDKVKDAYLQQQAEEKFGELKEKLANLTYEHPETLQNAATVMNLPIQTSIAFTKEKGGTDISSHNKVREAAFSSDVLNSQNNSDVIPLSPDKAIVLRIKTHAPATLLPLATVEKQIIDKLKTTEAEELAQKQAAMIVQKLNAGEPLTSLSSTYHLTWTDAGLIGRRSNKVDAAILDQAFAMPRTNNKPVYSFVKTPTGYAIIALSDVHDGAAKNNKEQDDVFSDQIQNSQGSLEYTLYKQSLMNQAKIVINTPQQDSGTFTN